MNEDNENFANGYKSIIVKTKTENVAEIIAMLEEETEKKDVPPKVVSALSIAVDELFSNVVKFSGSDEVTVGVCVEKNVVSVRICDNGVPYDPLSAEKPDVTLSAKERTPGGLGIFMVKKMTDGIEYERTGDMNVVTVHKNISTQVK